MITLISYIDMMYRSIKRRKHFISFKMSRILFRGNKNKFIAVLIYLKIMKIMLKNFNNQTF